MANAMPTIHFRFWLSPVRAIGVLAPRRLRADWRQECEAELRYRETLLAEWDKLNWKTKLDLLRRNVGAFWDAQLLQPKRLEDEMFQDLRFGLRLLLKHRGFTAVAMLSLALGIGANTAIFSLINATLLKTLPVKDPHQLLFLWWPGHKALAPASAIRSSSNSTGTIILSRASSPPTLPAGCV